MLYAAAAGINQQGGIMFVVDALGLSCPLPVVKTQKAMKEHAGEQLRVKVDLVTAREHIKRLGEDKGYQVQVTNDGDEIHLKLTPSVK
jgi:TusA-related sulfurtransferase